MCRTRRRGIEREGRGQRKRFKGQKGRTGKGEEEREKRTDYVISIISHWSRENLE